MKTLPGRFCIAMLAIVAGCGGEAYSEGNPSTSPILQTGWYHLQVDAIEDTCDPPRFVGYVDETIVGVSKDQKSVSAPLQYRADWGGGGLIQDVRLDGPNPPINLCDGGFRVAIDSATYAQGKLVIITSLEWTGTGTCPPMYSPVPAPCRSKRSFTYTWSMGCDPGPSATAHCNADAGD